MTNDDLIVKTVELTASRLSSYTHSFDVNEPKRITTLMQEIYNKLAELNTADED